MIAGVLLDCGREVRINMETEGVKAHGSHHVRFASRDFHEFCDPNPISQSLSHCDISLITDGGPENCLTVSDHEGSTDRITTQGMKLRSQTNLSASVLQ